MLLSVIEVMGRVYWPLGQYVRTGRRWVSLWPGAWAEWARPAAEFGIEKCYRDADVIATRPACRTVARCRPAPSDAPRRRVARAAPAARGRRPSMRRCAGSPRPR